MAMVGRGRTPGEGGGKRKGGEILEKKEGEFGLYVWGLAVVFGFKQGKWLQWWSIPPGRGEA